MPPSVPVGGATLRACWWRHTTERSLHGAAVHFVSRGGEEHQPGQGSESEALRRGLPQVREAAGDAVRPPRERAAAAPRPETRRREG